MSSPPPPIEIPLTLILFAPDVATMLTLIMVTLIVSLSVALGLYYLFGAGGTRNQVLHYIGPTGKSFYLTGATGPQGDAGYTGVTPSGFTVPGPTGPRGPAGSSSSAVTGDTGAELGVSLESGVIKFSLASGGYLATGPCTVYTYEDRISLINFAGNVAIPAQTTYPMRASFDGYFPIGSYIGPYTNVHYYGPAQPSKLDISISNGLDYFIFNVINLNTGNVISGLNGTTVPAGTMYMNVLFMVGRS